MVFGWDNFTLTTPDSKMEYIASQMYLALHRLKIPSKLINLYMSDEFGIQITTQENSWDNPSVDHQSVWQVPLVTEEGTTFINELWLQDLKQFIADDDRVAILGGNDNDDGHHYDGQGLSIDASAFDGVCSYRREAPGLWTFFSPRTGAKMTVDLDPTRKDLPKSTIPELVDMKITDFCPFGCAFCYQGSTTAGKHSNFYGVRSFIAKLGSEGVFEIAFGGGEPTLHPEFIEILEYCVEVGIRPSFTTKNLTFFRDKDKMTKVRDLVGGIAFSVDNAAQMKTWGLVASKLGGNTHFHPNKFVAHVVMGAQNEEDFRTMLKEAKAQNIHVTLLGYKTTGRGSSFSPHDYSNVVDVLLDLMSDNLCPSISIDTALARTHGDKFNSAGFPSVLFYTKEGHHSLYIDAVDHKYGASSYSDNLSNLPRDFNVRNIWGATVSEGGRNA